MHVERALASTTIEGRHQMSVTRTDRAQSHSIRTSGPWGMLVVPAVYVRRGTRGQTSLASLAATGEEGR